jgi:EpsI family protein
LKLLAQSQFVRVLTLVLVFQAVLFYSASRGELIPVMAPLAAFPVEIAGWQMTQEGVIDDETRDVLKADDLLTRWYESSEGAANLFVAFFKTQRTGQSPHSPRNCLPGSGWQPSESGRINLLVGDGAIRINHYLVSKGENQSLVLYWYQSHGRVIADEFTAKFFLVADSIRQHRSDTALIRVVVPIPERGEDLSEKVATDFVKAFYPALMRYLPQ